MNLPKIFQLKHEKSLVFLSGVLIGLSAKYTLPLNLILLAIAVLVYIFSEKIRTKEAKKNDIGKILEKHE